MWREGRVREHHEDRTSPRRPEWCTLGPRRRKQVPGSPSRRERSTRGPNGLQGVRVNPNKCESTTGGGHASYVKLWENRTRPKRPHKARMSLKRPKRAPGDPNLRQDARLNRKGRK